MISNLVLVMNLVTMICMIIFASISNYTSKKAINAKELTWQNVRLKTSFTTANNVNDV